MDNIYQTARQIVKDLKLMNLIIETVFTRMADDASQKKTGIMHAYEYLETGKEAISGSVLCNADLSSSACRECLKHIVKQLPTRANGSEIGMVLSSSCRLYWHCREIITLIGPPSLRIMIICINNFII